MAQHVLPPRLLRAAKPIFDALNAANIDGVLVGGAAAAMLGSTRHTRDVDINVTSYEFNHAIPNFYIRHGPYGMLFATYQDPDGKSSIKCDINKARAHLMPLFKRHSFESDGIWSVSPELLLAKKISTCADRSPLRDDRRANDLNDIVFCINLLFEERKKMPEELKILYTEADWATVCKYFDSVPQGRDWTEIAQDISLF